MLRDSYTITTYYHDTTELVEQMRHKGSTETWDDEIERLVGEQDQTYIMP